jgi:hypothetical protein
MSASAATRRWSLGLGAVITDRPLSFDAVMATSRPASLRAQERCPNRSSLGDRSDLVECDAGGEAGDDGVAALVGAEMAAADTSAAAR